MVNDSVFVPMYDPTYQEAIDLAVELHKKHLTKINTSVKDVRLAIYYLQGGVISEAFRALRSWSVGDLVTPARSKRYIDECRDLAINLYLVENPERYLKRFFNDEITVIDIEKHIIDAEKKGLTKQIIDDGRELQKKLTHGFSKGAHPTLSTVAYNSLVASGEYDYVSHTLSFAEIGGFDFGPFLIVPMIDSLTFTSTLVFGIPKVEYKPLMDLRERIHEESVKKGGKKRP